MQRDDGQQGLKRAARVPQRPAARDHAVPPVGKPVPHHQVEAGLEEFGLPVLALHRRQRLEQCMLLARREPAQAREHGLDGRQP